MILRRELNLDRRTGDLMQAAAAALFGEAIAAGQSAGVATIVVGIALTDILR